MLASNLFSDEEFKSKFAYDHFYKKYGMDSFNFMLIEQSDSFRAFAAVARSGSDKAFTEEDRDRFVELLPHFLRALHINRTLWEQKLLANFGLDSINRLNLPVLLTDAHGRMIQRNRAAEEAEQAGYYATPGQHVHLADRDANSKLQEMISRPLTDKGCDNSVRFQSAGKRGLFVCCAVNKHDLLQGNAHWAIFLLREASDIAIPLDWIQSFYDFTPAETRVLKLLLEGKSPPILPCS